tara:strand:- start:510 stop:662 length:153 start_codon:yes stop_codon:yes gene_type:complete
MLLIFDAPDGGVNAQSLAFIEPKDALLLPSFHDTIVVYVLDPSIHFTYFL